MELDPETVARFLAAICKQAIRDYRDGWHEAGSPDATAFCRRPACYDPMEPSAGQSATKNRSIATCGRPRNPTPARKAVMDDELTTIDGMIALSVPVLPMLEHALRYTNRLQGTSALYWGYKS